MTRSIPATPSTLWATLNDPTLSDVSVELDTGAYGDIWLPGVTYAGLVTLRPKAGASPAITSMEVNPHNVRVTGFDIAMVPTTQYGVTVYGSNVTIDGNEIHQGDNKTLEGVGVWIRNADKVSVTNNHIHHVGDGTDSLNTSNLTIQGNAFDHYASNATFQSAVTTCLVDGNTFTNGIEQPDSSHPDHIQFAGIGGRSSKVQISNNVITRGPDGTPFQGPFIESTDGLKIMGNAMQGCALNSISVSDSSEVEIGDNFVQALPDVGARVIVRGASKDVNIHGNVVAGMTVNGATVPAISDYNDGTPNQNVTIAPDNTIVADATSPTDLSAMKAWLAARGNIPAPPAPDPLQPALDAANATISNQAQTITTMANQLQTANAATTAANAKASALSAANSKQAAAIAAAAKAVAAAQASLAAAAKALAQ